MTAIDVKAPAKNKTASHWIWPVVALALFGFLLFLPGLQGALGYSPYLLIFSYTVFYWITQASSWNIFSGFSGYLNFGFAAFSAVGVYTTALMSQNGSVPILVPMVVGGILAAALAVVLGLILFLRGLAHEIFALVTFAITIGLALLVHNVKALGGPLLMVGAVEFPEWMGGLNQSLYLLALILCALTLLIAALVQRSSLGTGLAAIRDDEPVAETMGVPTLKYKLIALAISAALAGASGALNAVMVSFIEPEPTFGMELSVFVVLMALLGGTRHWAGPLFGALLIATLSDRLTGWGMSDLAQLITGAILVLIVLRLRAGLFDRIRHRRWVVVPVAVIVLLVLWLARIVDFIDALLYAQITALIVLLLPSSLFRRKEVQRG